MSRGCFICESESFMFECVGEKKSEMSFCSSVVPSIQMWTFFICELTHSTHTLFFLMLSDIRIIINFSSRLSEDWKSQCDAMTSASQCTGKMSELDYNFNLMRRFIMYSPPFISYITANLLLSDQINVCVIMLLLW